MQKLKKKKLFSQRIATIAGEVVSMKSYVSTIDLMLKLNWLTANQLNNWMQGKVPYLELVISANLGKISTVMKDLKSWALYSKLKPSITIYKHKNYKLRFSKTGHPNIETAYSTHYVLLKSQEDKH